jgi:hypothetical protein
MGTSPQTADSHGVRSYLHEVEPDKKHLEGGLKTSMDGTGVLKQVQTEKKKLNWNEKLQILLLTRKGNDEVSKDENLFVYGAGSGTPLSGEQTAVAAPRTGSNRV